jgi:UDP-N-acetylglucosamine 2-epimerase (non-hydrolysing)
VVKPVVAFVVGTRPDTIKSAPVILELQRYADKIDTVVIATGQHREMLRQALDVFSIEPDLDLAIMQAGQSLADITTRTLSGLEKFFHERHVDLVLAQGDTTTTFTAGLASFYRQIPFGHIEAGLRTNSIWNPFPEEFNRRAVSMFSKFHFAPTTESAQNLADEGIVDGVFVTGNTGIDAVKLVASLSRVEYEPDHDGPVILLTTHRRENWGEPQESICRAARRLLDTFEDAILICPMHRNPDVREVLVRYLGDHPRTRLIEPPDYSDFVPLMRRSTIILTDSGGVQEEAPAFGIPVLVLRETTERPEGVTAGVAKLVGTDEEKIFSEASELLSHPKKYSEMAQARSPYGDGRAAMRIRFAIMNSFGLKSPAEDLWTS